MSPPSLKPFLYRCGLALMLAPLPAAAFADGLFSAPAEFTGRFRVSAAEPGAPVFAGSTVTLAGSGLMPGQSVSFLQGTTPLGEGKATADDKGAVSFSFSLPADAASGIHPVIAVFENPASAAIVDVKVSQNIPLSGAEQFSTLKIQPAPGLYQSVYSAKSDALFVTASSYRPVSSALIKLNPDTLEEIARIIPPALPADPDKPLKAGETPAPVGVLGIDVDDSKGTVWTTNTFDNTVAVYSQDDLSLIRQFPAEMVYHSRDVRVDEQHGRAYVSSAATDTLHVFDTETLEKTGEIRIRSAKRGGEFYLLGLGIDPEGKWLFAISRVSNELAVIDLATGELAKVIDLTGAKNASGLDYDPASGKLFIASQDSDNLLIVDLESGAVEHNVPVGAGALNVVFEPVSKQAFVASRGAGQIAVVSLEGQLVANLDGGSYANHVSTDGKGAVFAVNKSLGEEDPGGDQVLRLSPAQ